MENRNWCVRANTKFVERKSPCFAIVRGAADDFYRQFRRCVRGTESNALFINAVIVAAEKIVIGAERNFPVSRQLVVTYIISSRKQLGFARRVSKEQRVKELFENRITREYTTGLVRVLI